MKLVILESPNKIDKIAHYLGAGYDVVATAGHFRDLPERELGVDLSSFAPSYVVHENKKDLLARIKAKAKQAEQILLATDKDREGEAIAWHLAQELRLSKPLRLRYNEITEKGLKAALADVSPLDQHLVDAQQARRVIDRLVGYQVSPQLGVFGRNHSAGRVQSATLHLVVARELERERFTPTDYWTLTAKYGNGLTARYAALDDNGKLVDTRLPAAAEAEAIAAAARAAQHRVRSVVTAPKERRPAPPFTTSTVQQAASSSLRFKPDHTMALLQKLFEAGAITYHRTDSVALSDEAVSMARAFIERDYPQALPDRPVNYKSKGDAQGAHEAIRPTSLDAPPSLAGDEAQLYELIRRRFIACQCKPAVLSQTTVTIDAASTTWRAVGSVVTFDSFLRYLGDEEDDDQDDDAARMPAVAEGEVLELADLAVAAKQTKPPPRFTQAELIKAMEAEGIGRPATYANTVALLFARDYIAEDKRFVFPTPRGRLIDSVLAAAYPEILETATTAAMEARLDEIAEGKRRWQAEVRDWYGPFSARLADAPAIFARERAARPELAGDAPPPPKPTGKPCPLCGKELMLRTRKSGAGEFLSCSGYPSCSYAADPSAQLAGRKCPRCARDLLLLPRPKGEGEYLSCTGRSLKDARGRAACDYTADPSAKPSDRSCPKCSGPMEELAGRHGPYARCLKASCDGSADLAPPPSETCPVCDGPMRDRGTFLSCGKYPACKGSYNKAALAHARTTGATCPQCSKPLLEKKNDRGAFLACSAYPKCKYVAKSQRQPSATS